MDQKWWQREVKGNSRSRTFLSQVPQSPTHSMKLENLTRSFLSQICFVLAAWLACCGEKSRPASLSSVSTRVRLINRFPTHSWVWIRDVKGWYHWHTWLQFCNVSMILVKSFSPGFKNYRYCHVCSWSLCQGCENMIISFSGCLLL